MKALILDNQVIDVNEKETPAAPTCKWVDCDDKVQIGWGYDGSKFTDPVVELDVEPTTEQLEIEVRSQRNMLLQQSDWTQSRDVTLSNDADWKTYRQSLRDIPSQSEFPKKITWPTAP
jgi:hypothetical protein